MIYQLCDSAFPAGSFAHSCGLEVAWQDHFVRDGSSFESWLRWQLHQTASSAALFVAAVFQTPARLDELDALCDAMLINHVANRASRAQGGALIVAVARVFAKPAMIELADRLRANTLVGHLAPTFGMICSHLELDLETAVRIFLFTQMRGMISAGIRLGIVGPLNGQAIQHAVSEYAESLVAGAMRTPVEAAAQTAPILDLIHNTHDRLYSRLFQS